MNCRGTETRQRLVREYNIKPLAHIKLLAGQSKHSDAEATIIDEYYIFSAVNKINGQVETIQCGMGAARDFLNILGIKGLPLFNPLKEESGHLTTSKGIKNNSVNNWNPTAKQLYNAIMWLIIAWDAKPNTPLFKIRDDIVKYKNQDSIDWIIRSVNTVIKNGGKGKTLTEIVNKFRMNNTLKDSVCDFSLLSDRMAKIHAENGNTIESFF